MTVFIIDECHRSIYNVWQQVLDYFDAFLIGLTATRTSAPLPFSMRMWLVNILGSRPLSTVSMWVRIPSLIETQVTKSGAPHHEAGH